MRKLASVQIIESLTPIEGADRIELATVLGWQVVVQKGLYEVGDKCIYMEIDSWVPHSLVDLSRGGTVKTFRGVEGNRLKTIKLKGNISQGMCLPMEELYKTTQYELLTYDVDSDVTEALGIQKYEVELPAQLYGVARGNFPSWLRKTDQDRIQGVYKRMLGRFDEEWVIEEKLEGSSMTVGKRGEEIVVCSRNLSLKIEENENNSFVKTAIKCGILDVLAAYPRNIGISGELIGPGIQKNIYLLSDYEWRIFDILDVDTGKYVNYEERMKIIAELREMGADLEVAPRIEFTEFRLNQNTTLKDILTLADGKSVLNLKQWREGLVFKNQTDPDISFKAISNTYLLKVDV